MARLLISTSRRYTKHNQPSGHLFVYDLAEKKVIRKCEIIEPPYRNVDPNPRGGFRGLKGISIEGNKIAIANASTVFVYDNNWKPLNYFWHPSCAGIHDILVNDDRVWVSSSRNDLLICFNMKGQIDSYLDIRKFAVPKEHSPHRLKPFLNSREIKTGKINFRDPRTHDHAYTDLMHINSLALMDDGSILVSCGLFRYVTHYGLHKLNNFLKRTPFSGVLPQLDNVYKMLFGRKHDESFEAITISKRKTSSLLLRIDRFGNVFPILVFKGCNVPSHSVRMMKDGTLIYLNTTTGEIVRFNPRNNLILNSIKVGKKFLRGAIQLSDGSLILGDNNYIIHLNLKERTVLSRLKITEDESEAVFDIHTLPDDFELPPESFVSLHKESCPLKQK